MSGLLDANSRRDFQLPRAGVLCETMGYGKTAVVLAFIASTRGERASVLPPRVDAFRQLPPHRAIDYSAAQSDRTSLSLYEFLPERVDSELVEPAVVACACDLALSQRDDATMRQCDACLVWTHPSCVPSRENENVGDDAMFLCASCLLAEPPRADDLEFWVRAPPLVTSHRAARATNNVRHRVWRSASTLIVVPSTLNTHVWLREWRKVFWQPEECTEGSGRSAMTLIELKTTDDVRRASPFDLLAADVVLCTRESLRSLCEAGHVKPIASVSRVHWRHIIVDEGHTAGNLGSKQTQAVLSLHADAKWLISATPQTQARPAAALTQLLSLVQFCGGQPWVDHVWLRRFRGAFGLAYSKKPVMIADEEPVAEPEEAVAPPNDLAFDPMADPGGGGGGGGWGAYRFGDDDDGDDAEPPRQPSAIVPKTEIKLEPPEPSIEPASMSFAGEHHQWTPILIDDEKCRAAHELLLAYLNAVMIRHRPEMIDRLLHQGTSRVTRFVQFKPYEQIAYNLHVVAVHVNELTSRGTDQDSFVNNAVVAKESFVNLMRSCTVSSAFTHEQLAVLLYSIESVLTARKLDVPLRDDERDELHFIRAFVCDVIRYEAVLLRALANTLETTALDVAERTRTPIESVWQRVARHHVDSFVTMFEDVPARINALMHHAPPLSAAEKEAFYEQLLLNTQQIAHAVGVDGLLCNRCLECGTLPCGSKLDAAVDTVARAVARGQKVLVFSAQEDAQDVELLPVESTTSRSVSRLAASDDGADGAGAAAAVGSPPSAQSPRRRRRARQHKPSRWAGLMLDTLRARLELLSIKCVVLEEQRTAAARDHSIRQFQVDPSLHVLLLKTSTPSAVFGIDLHVASCVLFLEPSLNEAIEISAVARAARAGQTRRVDVTTLAVQGTCEEDVLLRRSHLNLTSLELLLAAMPVPDSLVDAVSSAHYGSVLGVAQDANVKAEALYKTLQRDLDGAPPEQRPPGLGARPADSDCCTFAFTNCVGEQQLMYHCYTCGLVDEALVCVCCARRCHVGHMLSPACTRVAYCDCAVTECVASEPTPPEARHAVVASVADDPLFWLPPASVTDKEPFCWLPQCIAADAMATPSGAERREVGRWPVVQRRASALLFDGRLPRAQMRFSEPFNHTLHDVGTQEDGGGGDDDDEPHIGDLMVHVFRYDERVRQHRLRVANAAVDRFNDDDGSDVQVKVENEQSSGSMAMSTSEQQQAATTTTTTTATTKARKRLVSFAVADSSSSPTQKRATTTTNSVVKSEFDDTEQ